MKCWILTLSLLLATHVLAQPLATLADGRSGDIEFNSHAPTGHNAIATGTFDRKAVPIRGQLSLPAGFDKVPAVVIGHTVGGVQPFLMTRWVKALNEAGIATFVVDSFGPRRMFNVWAKERTDFNGAFLIADAFKALELLATHPRLDAGRIGFLGFSMGGFTAQYIIHERFRRSLLGDSPVRYAVGIGHYPGCQYNFYEEVASKTPLHLFLGEKDNWLPAEHCQRYAEFLKGRGYAISVKTYAGASHGYDEDHPLQTVADATSSVDCEPLLINLDKPLAPVRLRDSSALSSASDLRSVVGAVYKWAQSCSSRGPSAGITPGPGDRRDEAVRDTLLVLRDRLKATP
jgi:dienelactone hydrolase